MAPNHHSAAEPEIPRWFIKAYFGVTASLGAGLGYALSARAIHQPAPPDVPSFIERHEQIVNVVSAVGAAALMPFIIMGLFLDGRNDGI